MHDPEVVADEQPREKRSRDAYQAKKRPREHDRGRQHHLANRPVFGSGRQDGVGFDLDGHVCYCWYCPLHRVAESPLDMLHRWLHL